MAMPFNWSLYKLESASQFGLQPQDGLLPPQGGLPPSQGGLLSLQGGLQPQGGLLSPQGGLQPQGGLLPSQGGLPPPQGGIGILQAQSVSHPQPGAGDGAGLLPHPKLRDGLQPWLKL